MCPQLLRLEEGRDTIGNKEEEGNYENRVRLLKGNPFLGWGRKLLRQNMYQEKPFSLGFDLGGCFPSGPIQVHTLGGDISSFSSKKSILIQEVLSHLQVTTAILVSTCVMFP